MVLDQILDMPNSERNSNGDADGADRQKLDAPLNPHWTMRSDAFERWQTDHLRSVKKQVARAAFAGIDNKLCDRLAQKLAHRLARHLISDIKGVDIYDFAGIFLDFCRADFPLGLRHR